MSINGNRGDRQVTGTAALEKGLMVLGRIADAEQPQRFSDLLADTGLPKATLHRILQALLGGRYIAHESRTQTYRLGLRALELAQRSWEEMDVRKAAEAVIFPLGEETGETVHLAVLDGSEVVYIDKVESRQRIRMFSSVGKRGPTYCTGVGKAMLAFLDAGELDSLLASITPTPFTPHTLVRRDDLERHLAEIRTRGFALDLEEHEMGILCAAAPIFDHRGVVMGAVSVTGPSFRFDLERLHATAPKVVEAARAITSALGGRLASHPPREAAAVGAVSPER